MRRTRRVGETLVSVQDTGDITGRYMHINKKCEQSVDS